MSDGAVVDEQRLAERIVQRAAMSGIDLDLERGALLARHMRMVIEADPAIHLTSIRTVDEFFERHVGESFEGAAMLRGPVDGWLLDLGSGNGYPGLPVVACHRGLCPLLAEVSARKAQFLRSVIEVGFEGGKVIDRQIQRAEDLVDHPQLSVIATRAMGNWERVLPRLSSRLVEDGRVLVWAGQQMEVVSNRKAWKRFELIERRALPGRDRSWVWHFRATSPDM